MRVSLPTAAHRTVTVTVQAVRWGLQAGLAVALGLWLVAAFSQRGWERLVALTVQGFTVVLTFLSPLAGFLFWLILAPFGPFWNFDLPMGAGVPDLSLVRTGTLAVGFVLLAQLAARKRALPPLGWTEIGVLLFLVGMLQATRMALKGMVPALQTAFDAYVIPLSAYFFMRLLIDSERALRQALCAYIIVVLYVAFLALHESWTGVMWFYPWGRAGLYAGSLRRVVALFGNPVYHALIMVSVLPAAIYLFVRSRRWWSALLALALVGLMTTTVIFLYSRAGYLATFLVMTVMAVRFPRWRWVFLAGLIAGAVTLAFFWSRFTQSELYRYRLSNQVSVEARARTADVALQLWRESPLFGIGYPNYGPITLQRGYFVQIDDKWMPAPHNTFFGILSQAGLIALTGYVLMWVGIGREIAMRYRQLREEVEGRTAGLWRSTLGLDADPDAASGWAVVALAMTLGYLTIIVTIDADPAQYSNIVFYSLLGGILGYMAHAHRDATPRTTEAP